MSDPNVLALSSEVEQAIEEAARLITRHGSDICSGGCEQVQRAEAVLRDLVRKALATVEGPWRGAVIDACVVNFIPWTDDPRETLANLLATEITMALDPAISESAAKLKAEGAEASREQARALAEALRGVKDWVDLARFGQLEGFGKARYERMTTALASWDTSQKESR